MKVRNEIKMRLKFIPPNRKYSQEICKRIKQNSNRKHAE